MNLTFHIVKKDLRRFWIPLALFAAVIAAKIVLGALLRWQSGSFESDAFGRFALYINFASVIEGVVIFVLVAALVHEDPLVGTQAFWMTKPISGLRLLGAKALTFLLVFVVLPALVTLPWWLACNFEWRDIGLAVWRIMAVNGMLVILALPFAVLTGTFARYLAALLVTVVLVMVVSTMDLAANLSGPAVLPGILLTRFWVVSGFVVAAAVALVVHQYRTRRFWQSLTLLAAAFAATLFIALGLQRDWSSSWAPLTDSDPALTRQIGLTAHDASLEYLNPTLSSDKAYALTTHFSASGVPDDDELLTVSSHHTWLWPDGTKLEREGSFYERPGISDRAAAHLLGLPEHKPDPDFLKYMAERAQAGRILDWTRPSTERSGIRSFNIGAIPSIPFVLGGRLRDEPPAYDFKGRFRLMQPLLVGEKTLRDGEAFKHGAFGASIRHSWLDEKRGRGLAVSLLEWMPATAMRAPATFGMTESSFRPDTSGDLRLVNRSRGNFVPEAGDYRRIDIAGVSVIRRTAYFRAHQHWDAATKKWLEDPDWFHDLSLAIFTFRSVATFHRHLQVDRLSVAGSTAGGSENK